MEKLVVKLLTEKGYTIASAESCTGGLFASTIINVKNASTVIESSIVTYSNHAKQKYCSVDEKIIDSFGVVSEEVAYQMAKGISLQCNSNVGVGITGYAGKSEGLKNEDVGRVCFGICINGKVTTYTKKFSGGRQSVRKKSVRFVLKKLIELLASKS